MQLDDAASIVRFRTRQPALACPEEAGGPSSAPARRSHIRLVRRRRPIIRLPRAWSDAPRAGVSPDSVGATASWRA